MSRARPEWTQRVGTRRDSTGLQTSNSLVARAHIRICEMPASVASPYQALYRFNYSPLLLLPGSLARITHRRASLFLIKLLWNVGKADKEEVGVKRSLCIGGAKYFIDPSIALCDWVVCAVNTGDKPMGHWLLAVPAWCQKKHSVGPLSASAHRENALYARLPVQSWMAHWIMDSPDSFKNENIKIKANSKY